MSVPTVFANGCHLDLSLSGNKVAVLDSVKIKSLRNNVQQRKQSLNQNDVLPSITPSSESVRSPTLITPEFQLRNNVSGPSVIAREVNIIIQDGSSFAEYHALRAEPKSAPPKQVWIKEKSLLENPSSNNGSKDEDFWEDEEDENQDENRVNYAETVMKKKHKRKKRRSKSKLNNRSAKSSRSKMTEEVYTNLNLFHRNAQLEAFCLPAKIMSVNQQKMNKKLDYSKYINEKAPSISKMTSHSKTEVLLKKAQDIISSATLKSKSFQTEKSSEKSPYTTKIDNKIVSASVDPLTFKMQTNKSSHLIRKSINSTPIDIAIPKIIKVYLSEKQSKDIEELGMEIPAAPPGTPMPEMLKQYDYIPCMNDIRSQRAVKLKLDYMAKIEKQRQDKIKEEKAKKDKIHQKEKIKETRKQQRREIYALNKMMTEFEHKNFLEFCRQNGVSAMS